MKEFAWMVAATAVMSYCLIGCTQEAREQYHQAGENLSQGTKETGQAMATDAEKSGAAAVKTAQAAGQEVKNAAENSKQAADAGLETTKVKSALDTAAGLSTKDINVDTNMDTRTITLKGSVPDEKQKQQAETVAKGIAGTQFKVDNQLTVSGAAH